MLLYLGRSFGERWPCNAAKKRKERKYESTNRMPRSQNPGYGEQIKLQMTNLLGGAATADGAKEANRSEKNLPGQPEVTTKCPPRPVQPLSSRTYSSVGTTGVLTSEVESTI